MKSVCVVILILVFGGVGSTSAQTVFDTNPADGIISIIAEEGFTAGSSIQIVNPGTGPQAYCVLTNPPELLQDQVAYFPFDATRTDLITHAANISVNGTTFVNDHLERVDSALQFDGNDDQINTRDFALENSFSISFWACPTRSMSLVGAGYYSNAVLSDYLLYPSWGGAGTRAGLGIALGTNGIMIVEHADMYMPVLISIGADLSGWNFYTVVFENLQPRLYINGAYQSTGLFSQKSTTYMSNQFGHSYYGIYQGGLDELSVFDTALTPAQIQAAYSFTYPDRYEVLPRWGTLDSGQTVALDVNLVDTQLASGQYQNAHSLCQCDLVPLYDPLAVDLDVVPVSLPTPLNLQIAMQPNRDVQLSWDAVTATLMGNTVVPEYEVYVANELAGPDDFLVLDTSAVNSFLHVFSTDMDIHPAWFYRVRAYLPD